MRDADVRLAVHHVGGRWGSRAFPKLPAFERDVVNVLYDADEDCLPQIESRNRDLASELHVLPYCLAGTRRTGTLNITYDPYGSSIYDPNPDYSGYYTSGGGLDYMFGEAFELVERRQVEMTTLDELRDTGVPAPDFLSVDTQGAEYEILTGAEETLRAKTLAIVAEVEFHPLYRRQPLFGDVSSWLAERGFAFARFLQLVEASPARSAVGLRAGGFHVFAEALFVRRIDDVARGGEGDDAWIKLRKLAFIAVVFEQVEYAFACLAEAARLTPSDAARAALAARGYGRFLAELEEAAASLPARFPRTFGEAYTLEASKARFDDAAPPPAPRAAPWLPAPARRLARRLRTAVRTRDRPRETEVEAVLKKYGLDGVAAAVEARRHHDWEAAAQPR